jgi:hypothetical protein
MKKITFLSLLFFIAINSATAQKTTSSTSIISIGASIKKYHLESELETMQKGQLLDLYIERIQTLINTLPYIALTKKPGVTMKDVGVPDTSENIKSLSGQKENTQKFLQTTIEFQRTMMPYSDKRNLIASILYYEAMLKELNQLNQ